MARRIRWAVCAAGILLLAWSAGGRSLFAEDAFGGLDEAADRAPVPAQAPSAKPGENRTPPAPSGRTDEGARAGDGARPAAAESPWPEPDPKAVERLTAELRAQLPAAEFRIARVGPWIVATDLDAASAERFLKWTIGEYAAKVQRQLFTAHARQEPVKLYLFKDKVGYESWNLKLFGAKPHTPFGYYSHEHNALVMNIGTGGGTLLHEMVHAMTAADWPEIPAWLNEGLGSLFEAAGRDAKGRAIGVTNWRLQGLQDGLRAGTAPHFEALLRATDEEFYAPARSGANYAAVRYLMQYLQERGKLEAFYWRVRDGKDADALATLRAVFEGRLTVAQIEQACYDWVKTLR